MPYRFDENTDSLFEKTFELASVGIAHVDLDGSLIRVNQRLCKIVGYSKEELLELTFEDITHPEDIEKDADFIDNMLKGTINSYKTEIRFTSKSGSIVWVDLSVSMLVDDNNRPVCFIWIANDITESKDIQEKIRLSESNLRKIVYELPFPAIIYDTNHKVVLVNREWTNSTGYTQEMLPTIDRWTELAYRENSEAVVDLINRLNTERETNFVTIKEVHTLDNKRLTWKFHSILVEDTNTDVDLRLTVAVDITETIAKEKKLTKSNKELEQFAYVVSHDLQEPLRTVSGFTTVMLDELGSDISNDMAIYAKHITNGVARMQSLLDHLLSYSRITTRTQSFTPLPLTSILDDVKESLDRLITETGSTLRYGHLPIIQGDRNQITVLFQNLIRNAINYRSDRPCIVEIEVEQDEISHVIRVKDNGIGIPQKFHNQVFGIFNRLKLKPEVEGDGVGLATAKKIVEHHNGKIWISSNETGGVTINLEFPRGEE